MLTRDEERAQYEAWLAQERRERWLTSGCLLGGLCALVLIVWGLIIAGTWLAARWLG